MFLRRFGIKAGILFFHFGLGSGIVLEETSECKNVFIVSTPNEKERGIIIRILFGAALNQFKYK